MEGLEIERRFLLKRLPQYALTGLELLIEQFYIRRQDEFFRIRSEAPRARHHMVYSYDRTYKEKVSHGVFKEKIEVIDLHQFILFQIEAHKRMKKTRYVVPHVADLKWQIDKPLDCQLVIAEIELPAIDHPLTLPPFLQEVLIMEVTGMEEFSNYNLAEPIGTQR